MENLILDLSVVDGMTLRRQLIHNFKIMQKYMNGTDSEDNDEAKKRQEFYKQIQEEIRAICMPEWSPWEIAYQFKESLTDLKGIHHETLSLRLEADLEKMQRDIKTPGFVITQNGTLMPDVFDKSSLKRIKKIVCVGDSVAKGAGSNKNYGQYIAEKAGAKLENLAVSGATFSTVSSNNILTQAKKVTGADLVIIQGTDDDWLTGGGIPNGGVVIGGNPDDSTTFYGAFCTIIKTIKQNNPHAKIIAMTATRQLSVSNRTTVRRKDTDKNRYGLSLEDYVNRQVIACTELDIPVFDAYHTDLIDPYNPAYRKKNMIDGVHPNEFGHEVIAYELIKLYHWFYD